PAPQHPPQRPPPSRTATPPAPPRRTRGASPPATPPPRLRLGYEAAATQTLGNSNQHNRGVWRERGDTHKQPRIPRRVGHELLHRFVPRRRLLEPKQRRLQALPATLLDQPAHIQERVLPLHPQRERPRHLRDEPRQPIANLDRRHTQSNRGLHPLHLER